MATPIEIEVLLTFWYDPGADLKNWRPNQRTFINELIELDILRTEFEQGTVRIRGNTTALEPYIKAITKIPLPRQSTLWTLPD